ncbi:hypothetical protein EJ110_NYTH14637 [Nymphaea thermarum]|nr:hypothetical protein EJ110_NYTH14637 [Nymphaea thermarum]
MAHTKQGEGEEEGKEGKERSEEAGGGVCSGDGDGGSGSGDDAWVALSSSSSRFPCPPPSLTICLWGTDSFHHSSGIGCWWWRLGTIVAVWGSFGCLRWLSETLQQFGHLDWGEQVHRARPVDLEFVARGVLKSLLSAPQMEYQRRGKKGVEPSTEAHTPHDDNTLGQQNAQASVSAQTPPRQTPPVDQQALLLTTLQTLTSIVQSMAGNQRSQASPTRDTTAPPKEKATTVSFHHFMSMQLPVFTGDGSPDKAEEWIKEIERIFEQNHLSLEEYITKYRHLEAYCPHLYSTAEARADKFVYGLRDGLRGRVMSSSPHNLDEAVTMARRMEEDWVKTQRDHQKKTSQHTQGGRMPVKHQHPIGRARPYERRDDRTFRQNRPGRNETTQGSVASPTSPRCPTCSRVHPRKPCYRVHRARPVDIEFVARGVLKSFVSAPQVLADPGQQVEQMASLTSYWGGFGYVVNLIEHVSVMTQEIHRSTFV